MHYSAALKSLLRNVLVGDVVDYDHAEVLAQTWFTDKKAKKEVAEILRRFHLDESAIEAQAIKSVASELEILDKRLMSLETRRNRAIRNIAEYRESFARKVRESSGRIIEADSVVRLENLSGQKSA
jgi:ribonuclease D